MLTKLLKATYARILAHYMRIHPDATAWLAPSNTSPPSSWVAGTT